jgi:DNA-binding transcriptional LysR family regulator
MFEKLFENRGLSLDRLRSFLEVAAAGGISRAARGDAVRQSQFSRQIGELEAFFGIELVGRQGRGLQLTEAGKSLAAVAREQLMGLEDFRAHSAASPRTFRIGAGDSLLQWIILPRLARFQELFPRTQIQLFNLRSSDIAERLADLRLDFGLARASILRPPLKHAPAGDVRYALFIPKKLWPQGRPSEPKLMAELPWVTLGSDGEFMSQIQTAAVTHGLELQFKLVTESFPQAARAVHTGHYAAILPLHAQSDFDASEIRVVEAKFLKKTGRKVVLAWNPRLLRVRTGAELALNGLRKLFSHTGLVT